MTCMACVSHREMLPKAQEQPETTNMQDPDRPTPPGVVVVPITPQQPHTDTTALFQSSGLIRNKAALTAIGDSCGCMEYGYTRSLPAHTALQCASCLLFSSVLCCAVLCCAVLCCAMMSCAMLCCAVLCCAVPCCAVQCFSLVTNELGQIRAVPLYASGAAYVHMLQVLAMSKLVHAGQDSLGKLQMALCTF